MVKKGVFDFDTLSPNLKRFLPVIDAAVGLVFDAFEPRAETYMRDRALWTDRTANARNGLMAKHQSIPMVIHKLVLYHTMPYGFWLEVRWSGKYAIIGPTMFHISPEMAASIATAVNRAITRMPG